MARDPKYEAALALHRFGLGPRPGSIGAIASDPRGALLAELDRADAGHSVEPALATSAANARAVFAFRQEQRAVRQAQRRARETDMSANSQAEAKPPQGACLLYTSPSPRDTERSRMPSSA